ncbi:MAG: SGNH/GDSL hydrolase family protein, partial [Candidatus Sulfotelmatobacter sp.]
IGDSHTYGNTARMVESWPYVLGSLSGRSVYDMGMGGYGPNQYFYLLKTKALALKPRTILCGLYLGDDFENAYSITYGLNYWSYLRQLPAQTADFNIWDTAPPPPNWQKRTRLWLSRHSVVYQLVVHASSLGQMQGEEQIKNAVLHDGSVAVLSIPEKHILEAFRPKSMLSRLDQQSPEVREGMRITFELLKEMNDLCQQNHMQFVVVVIPTKETVFYQYLEHNPKIALADTIDKLLANERLARAATFKFLVDSNIPYVDPLPALRASVENQLYARSAGDMHPGKNGYRVIAQAAFAVLDHDRLN